MFTEGKWYLDGRYIKTDLKRKKRIAELPESGIAHLTVDKANGRRIVHCVNSHDKLVGIGKDLLSCLVAAKSYVPNIKEWDNVKEAKIWLGIGDIYSCLIGKQKTSNNYIWKYVEL